MTKIAVVCLLRNECDIVEFFARHIANLCDHIFFLDHQSTDATPLILERLAEEGLPLSVKRLAEPGYYQSAFTTRAVREIARLERFDYIIPLDVDEFPALLERRDLHDCLEEHVAGRSMARWPFETFCPISSGYFDVEAPLTGIFRPRDFESRTFYKIILENAFARDCTVETGNHIAAHPGVQVRPVSIPVALQHFPVRSVSQLANKVKTGSAAFRLAADRRPGDGYHWDVLAHVLGARNFQLSSEELKRVALRYTLLHDDPVPGIAMNKIATLHRDMPWRYRDEARIA